MGTWLSFVSDRLLEVSLKASRERGQRALEKGLASFIHAFNYSLLNTFF